MIKTFEQFVSDKYDKPINEAYQSSKLREIIKQHGKPKWSFEYKMLYDIKDNEIVDVLDNRKEYWEKYSSPLNKEEATFMLELEDGACIVISNLGVLKSYFDRGLEDKMKKVFKERHAERHVGNLGKYGELDIRKKHRENVDKILKKRLSEKLQPNIKEIAGAVLSVIDDIDISEFSEDNGSMEVENELRIGDNEYMLYVNYSYKYSDTYKKYGAEYCDITYSLDSFTIIDEDGTEISDKDLDLPSEIINDLFKEHIEEDVECGIYDYYSYYGVSPSDFY
jgi:hypothetical protein